MVHVLNECQIADALIDAGLPTCPKDDGIRRADEGALSRLLVETTILLEASRTIAATVLRDAATVYKVATDAITLKVKQEFGAKAKAKKEAKAVPEARKAA